MRLAHLIVLPLVLAGTATAVTINVPGDQATIAEALALANPGDTVAVATGIYDEESLELPAGVHLTGVGGAPGDIMIIAPGNDRILTVAGGNSQIANLRLLNGEAMRGGGILVTGGTPRFEDVEISGCDANQGGGVAVTGGQPTFERCHITNNTARSFGAGILLVDAPGSVLMNCVLAFNETLGVGGAWYVARGNLAVYGCTVAENRASLGAEGASFDSGGVFVDASIATGNHPATGLVPDTLAPTLLSDHAGRVTNTCSLRFQPGWPSYLADQLTSPTANNLHADPRFCLDEGAAQSWFGLAANSPCLPENNDGCDLIGAFGMACEPIGAPDTPAVQCRLHDPYPNPFNPRTNLRFTTGQDGPVQLVVYGLDGRRVATLVNESRPAGTYVAVWDGRDHTGRAAASGVYVGRLRADGTSAAVRLTLIK